MANHKNSLKAIRNSERKRLRNKLVHKTTRNAISNLKSITDKAEATESLPKIVSMIDRLAKKNIIHANKAANLKSKLTKRVSAIQ